LIGLDKIGIADCLEIDLGNGLLIGCKLASEEQIIRKEELAMMAGIEIGHLMLYFSDACKTRSFLHHLDKTLVF
jgi:hypothetical protein